MKIKRNLPPSPAETCIAASRAETEMYLNVAREFAEDGNEPMAAVVFGWCAEALTNKDKILRRRTGAVTETP